MRTQLGVIIGNELYNSQGLRINQPVSDTSRAVAVNDGGPSHALQPAPLMDEIDEIVSLLARATKLAQGLSAADQRRVRDFFHASLLHATTSLPQEDQSRFQNALRERS